jgi:lipid-A-disaccharide synthase-like uncharacterized protein
MRVITTKEKIMTQLDIAILGVIVGLIFMTLMFLVHFWSEHSKSPMALPVQTFGALAIGAFIVAIFMISVK